MTTKLEDNTVTRRQFLVRSAATAAGTFMSIALPSSLTSATAQAAMGEGMSAYTPAIWFTITPDGKTTMHILKAEMGQHIGTAMAQIIAEELEVTFTTTSGPVLQKKLDLTGILSNVRLHQVFTDGA